MIPPAFTRIRIMVVLARPPLVLLLTTYAALGLAVAGGATDTARAGVVMVVVVGYIVSAVATNDIADRAIDQINLPADAGRPLVSGAADLWEMRIVATVGAVLSITGSMFLSRPATIVVLIGLAVAAAYSLPPLRLSHRGALASVVLPAGYVAVPFLTGIFAVRPTVEPRDLALLAGLWIGFIGRILLKDFRDIKGDLIFGKRTFLIRHGRRFTCAFSALCWIVGSFALLAVRGVTAGLLVTHAVYIVTATYLLWLLGDSTNVRRDEWLVSAIAIVGRGMIMGLLVHVSLLEGEGVGVAYYLLLVGLLAMSVGQARVMVKAGPAAPLFGRHVPRSFLEDSPDVRHTVNSIERGSASVD